MSFLKIAESLAILKHDLRAAGIEDFELSISRRDAERLAEMATRETHLTAQSASNKVNRMYILGIPINIIPATDLEQKSHVRP